MMGAQYGQGRKLFDEGKLARARAVQQKGGLSVGEQGKLAVCRRWRSISRFRYHALISVVIGLTLLYHSLTASKGEPLTALRRSRLIIRSFVYLRLQLKGQ
jgi:hypothetical protein